jgi:phosphoribosylformylglycinamidine synthase
MAIAYGTPFISGKDSLNNEFEFEGKTISIPYTLLISAMGVMEDTALAVSMDFKKDGDLIYLVGATYNELGGSEYFRSLGFIGNSVPKVNPKQAKELMDNLSRATKTRLVRACHDLSDGGLGVALAEMAFAGGLGASVNLKDVPLVEPMARDDFILFSESNSRFLVEVAPEDREEFERTMGSATFACIGEVATSDRFEVHGLKGNKVLTLPVALLKEAWQKPLKW